MGILDHIITFNLILFSCSEGKDNSFFVFIKQLKLLNSEIQCKCAVCPSCCKY